MKKTEWFFLVVLPAFVTLLVYFIPAIEYPLKIIVPLLFTVLYFIILGIYLQINLTKQKNIISNLNIELENHKEERREEELQLNNKVEKYEKFLHKRKLFLDYDLKEIGSLITQYEGHVINAYRGQKHQEIRFEVRNVKNRTIELINKEKRDFDEGLFDVQSDKDN